MSGLPVDWRVVGAALAQGSKVAGYARREPRASALLEARRVIYRALRCHHSVAGAVARELDRAGLLCYPKPDGQ